MLDVVWMLDVGCWMLDVGCGCWMLDVGCWMLDVGEKTKTIKLYKCYGKKLSEDRVEEFDKTQGLLHN
jgi:hypothetical protein